MSYFHEAETVQTCTWYQNQRETCDIAASNSLRSSWTKSKTAYRVKRDALSSPKLIIYKLHRIRQIADFIKSAIFQLDSSQLEGETDAKN